MSKYSSVRTECDGIKFASKREALRYRELTLLQRGGVISDLKLQVRYPLIVNGVKVCTYVCDFQYTENGERVTEDAKGCITPVYRIKKALMKACHGITIREV